MPLYAKKRARTRIQSMRIVRATGANLEEEKVVERIEPLKRFMINKYFHTLYRAETGEKHYCFGEILKGGGEIQRHILSSMNKSTKTTLEMK